MSDENSDKIKSLSNITEWRVAVEGVIDSMLEMNQELWDEISRLRATAVVMETRTADGRTLTKVIEARRDNEGVLRASVFEQTPPNGNLKFAGPYNPNQRFPNGSVTHYRGSAWVAVRDVEPGEAVPEKGSLSWSLLAARGRDASGSSR